MKETYSIRHQWSVLFDTKKHHYCTCTGVTWSFISVMQKEPGFLWQVRFLVFFWSCCALNLAWSAPHKVFVWWSSFKIFESDSCCIILKLCIFKEFLLFPFESFYPPAISIHGINNAGTGLYFYTIVSKAMTSCFGDAATNFNVAWYLALAKVIKVYSIIW